MGRYSWVEVQILGKRWYSSVSTLFLIFLHKSICLGNRSREEVWGKGMFSPCFPELIFLVLELSEGKWKHTLASFQYPWEYACPHLQRVHWGWHKCRPGQETSVSEKVQVRIRIRLYGLQRVNAFLNSLKEDNVVCRDLYCFPILSAPFSLNLFPQVKMIAKDSFRWVLQTQHTQNRHIF